MPKEYQVLARAYRPQRFADVVGQEAILQTLRNALAKATTAHAYLFTGSRGVGKTTLARLFAKALNCQSPTPEFEPCNKCPSCLEIVSGQSLDVIEIDGASNRGIDDIREINETIAFAPSHGKYKIYIIDEVHMLTKEAFNALLKTLEEPPEKAKFFFATTEPHKVLPTIVSRCQRFDLGRISTTQIQKKLQEIAQDLHRIVEPEALELLSNAADGSLRDAESIFDQILCFANGPISAADVQNVLGLAPQHLLFSLDQAFSEFHLAFAFELVEELFQKGKHFGHFFEQLIEHYRNLAVCKTLGADGLHGSNETKKKYAETACLYTQGQCLTILDLLLTAEASFSRSASPRVTLELLLLQVLRTKNRIPVEVIVRKLSELEDSLLKAGTALNLPQEAPAAPAKPAFTPIATTPPTPEPVVVPLPEPIELKSVPFNPYQPEAEPKPLPEPIVALQPLIEPKVTPPPLSKQLPVEPIESIQTPSKHSSHYDTLMRFTAVELEGTFKP
ncbi:MAG TPA: DNA polymerase III subunit gamma/tau [Chlamydiales bacterium]|jgi:DNA polymerase-3 subunit gamma/tau